MQGDTTTSERTGDYTHSTVVIPPDSDVTVSFAKVVINSGHLKGHFSYSFYFLYRVYLKKLIHS